MANWPPSSYRHLIDSAVCHRRHGVVFEMGHVWPIWRAAARCWWKVGSDTRDRVELSYGRGQRTPVVVSCKNGSVLQCWQQAAASEKRSGFAREEPWYLFSAGAGCFRRPINTAWAVLKLGHVRFWQNRPGGFANSGGWGRWPRIRIEPNSQAYWSPIGSLLRAESLVPAGLL